MRVGEEKHAHMPNGRKVLGLQGGVLGLHVSIFWRHVDTRAIKFCIILHVFCTHAAGNKGRSLLCASRFL